MSKYTTEVRYICETFSGLDESKGCFNINEIVQQSRSKIFSFDYPIFDETYRGVIETKILKHYYTREIGLETVGLWLHKLDVKMNEIMPYYNQLYKSCLLEFNPFYNTDLTTKRDIKTNEKGNSKGETNTTTKEWELYSDTPQGSVTNLENETYLTNATKNTGDGNTLNKGETNVDNVQDYLETVKGKVGGENYSSLLEQYRKTFLNIDMMIIDELSDLFMNIW